MKAIMHHNSKKMFLIFMIGLFLFHAKSSVSQNNTATPLLINRVYGLTLTSIEDINSSVNTIKSFSKRTTTRVVFDEINASEYNEALNKLYPYTDIMGELCDSAYINNYTLDAYQKRVDEYINAHGDKVKIWEIGNEVNGDWTGDPSLVAQKTNYGYTTAKNRGYKTALTLYYNDYYACESNSSETMREWAKNHLNQELKEGIDYLFVSYYEEDCGNYQPPLEEWQRLFDELGEIFPHAKLGFGEVGISDVNKKTLYLQHYYTLDIQHPRYIGGHFWWYFKEDMIPNSKGLWLTLNQIFNEGS